DPKSGEPVFARVGRFGPMLQIGRGDGDEKPKFGVFPRNARLETITLEQALKMFDLPRVVGTTADGQEITANIGRFGPYIKISETFVSIKPASPFEITETEARDLYSAKLTADAEKNIADFGDIKVLKGRFGPYITDGKKNAKIPKDTDPKSITESEARKLLSAAPDKPKRSRFSRRAK
ncbi:DNA topoisomerase I, partial [Candidatus Saccharibacteria bacterium]|nr:DNA topoisomerase I [Candidatus Saccharibacteria bacterium]